MEETFEVAIINPKQIKTMAHHSSDSPFFKGEKQKELEEQMEKLARQFENRNAGLEMQPSAAFMKMSESFGDTGEFPQGKLSAADEGAIRFGIAAHDGKILIDFGKPVAWLGLDPEDAEAIAQSLLEKARQARNQRRL